jgi:shikimate dehydrogenase
MGWPINHSRSPLLHSHWLRHYNIDGTYVPMAVAPEQLALALRALPILGFAGCNLTIPHKTAALALMHEVEPAAQKIGAINTVVVRDDGSLYGRNTDVFGFAENLRRAGCLIADGAALVLGAGGAARAVLAALQEGGCPEIYLANRTRAKADELADWFGEPVQAIDWTERHDLLAAAHLIVNTTNQGQKGQPALDMNLTALPDSTWVTDIVYNPLDTPLLAAAKQRQLRTVDGLGMLLYQAQPAFAAWYGVTPDVTPALRAAVSAGL